MSQTFEEILASMLEKLDENPDLDINALVQSMNISQEGKAVLAETNQLIDGFAEKMDSLQKAREEGKSRKQWVLNEMDRIMEGRDESEKAQLVSAIAETCEKMNDETLAKED